MKVTELWQYPIKSCGAVALNEAETGAEGFIGDRRFQWVLENGRFVTQREFPVMALIKVTLHKEYLSLSYQSNNWSISLSDFTTSKEVTTWKDTFIANSYQGEVNRAISDILGVSVTLVSMPAMARPISDLSAEGYVSFADGLPYLITNEQSLIDLNHRLQKPVTMQHFRPNIVIDGTTAYEEDNWDLLQIGNVTFRAVKPCSRCVMTTINPLTAEKARDAEPLKTLASYRQTKPGKIIFGMNMIVIKGGVVKVGDTVELR